MAYPPVRPKAVCSRRRICERTHAQADGVLVSDDGALVCQKVEHKLNLRATDSCGRRVTCTPPALESSVAAIHGMVREHGHERRPSGSAGLRQTRLGLVTTPPWPSSGSIGHAALAPTLGRPPVRASRRWRCGLLVKPAVCRPAPRAPDRFRPGTKSPAHGRHQTRGDSLQRDLIGPRRRLGATIGGVVEPARLGPARGHGRVLR